MSSLKKLYILVEECRKTSAKLNKRVVWTCEVKKEVARLIQSGLSRGELSHTFGFGYPSLNKWFKEYSSNLKEEECMEESQAGFKCLMVASSHKAIEESLTSTSLVTRESIIEPMGKEEIFVKKGNQKNESEYFQEMNSKLPKEELTDCYHCSFRAFCLMA